MYDDNFRKLMQEIYRFNAGCSIFKYITGESPARCFELPLAVTNLEMKSGEKLLDVGAGDSCFGLFMYVYNKVNVTILDVDKRAMANKKYLGNKNILMSPVKECFNIIDRPKDEIKEKRYHFHDKNNFFDIILCDARNIDLPDSAFDAISFISSIEHIPKNGDILAIREASRCLKSGGKMFISVPYSQKFEEGVTHRGHFERRYDYNALHDRLISPSNLNIHKIGFIFDGKCRRFTNLTYYGLPSYLRYALGWTRISLSVSQYISGIDNANQKDAQFVWMILQK